MPSIEDVLNALKTNTVTACAGLSPAVTTFLDLPSSLMIENLGRGGNSLVSIFDLQMSNDSTRYPPYMLNPVVVNAVITSAVSVETLYPGATSVLTISNEPIVNDAVSLVVYKELKSLGNVVMAGAMDTAATLATALAAAINANTAINALLSAVATSNTITITNIGAVGLLINSYTGNNGAAIQCLGKEWRHFLVSGFTKTRQSRDAMSTALRSSYAQLMANYGLFMPDGTSARVLRKGDRLCRDTHYNDVFRYDAFIDAEVELTNTVNLYSVLLPEYTKTPS